MNRTLSLLLFVVLTPVAASAGQETTYKAPRTENGQPDLQGVWNFNSGVPLQRPAAFAGKKFFTKEEFDKQHAAIRSGLAAVAVLAPVENVGLDWLDDALHVDDLRTSLITYPANGRLPALVEGVRRMPRVEDFIAALGDARGGPPQSLPPLLAGFGGGKKDSHKDFSMSERCLSGVDVPFVPQFDGNYVQIIQARDHVALVTDVDRRVIALDGRPPLGDQLRSWAGTSRGHWEGETLVVETRNFDNRTQSFAGAGNSRDKVVTERFTRTSRDVIQYAATVVDPKTFQDRVELSFPMAHVDADVYEGACHEGNYSLANALSAARKDEREGNAVGPSPRLQQITLVDRQGKTVSTVAEPGVYRQAALSPDGTRVAVIRTDPETQDTDVWVYDVATGKGTFITRDATPNASPVWSPDGSQIAYVSVMLDGSYGTLSRRSSTGSGPEELLYRHSTSAAIVLTDWSADGLLCFWSEKTTYALPLNGERPSTGSGRPELAEGRKAIALSGGEFNVRGGRISPDGRFIAYASDESGRFQVYARPFSLAAGAAASPGVKPSPVSTGQAIGGIFWRQDGKEMFFLNSPQQALMAVDITTSPEVQAGTPRLLFQLPSPTQGPAQLSNVSTRDGQRFVFLVTVPAAQTPASAAVQK